MLTLCHNYFRVASNNKNNQDNQNVSRRKFVFGVFLLLLVVVLWVVSSELTRYIYLEKKLERPFLVTYVRSSLLFVYLLVLCFTPPTRDPCRPADYTQLIEPTAETDDENFFNESTTSLGDSTFVPVRAGETTDSDDAAPRAVRFNKVAEVRVMSAAQAGEALLARLS
uniref:Uncharacterized protein n=2 Tax=Pectinophora gossypiella TaxID=13191 RepID=A0A1E1WGH6_PECGO